MSFPYLDVPGFKMRTVMPFEFVDELEAFSPGWLAQNIANWTSRMNARFRKRYGVAAEGNSLPFGQQPPSLIASGTLPPAVSLIGRPVLGSMQLALQVLVGGPVGTATFQWSKDGGTTWTGPVTTAATVSLPGTGLVAVFPIGTYSTDNLYAAATPVPEVVLGWLTDFVSFDAMCRRFRTSQDPALVSFKERFDQSKAEVQEAADGKDGLFDLPVSEDKDSAVTTAAPLGYSETSPYVWTDRQAQTGTTQDSSGSGS